ncbi:MAG: hypothetical protein HY739_06355 [Desulfobacterales bacterium]|nr:hypothetical protein [Desulfobacterales bacterium]
MINSAIKKRFIGISIVISLMIVAVFIKVYSGSIKEYEKGEESFVKGETEAAIAHYQRSIQWYTPFNKYVSRSVERLWEIGNKAEKGGEDNLALKAYQELRSSLYSVRSFYTPYPEWIERCNDKISSLVAKKEPYSKAERGKTFVQRKAESLKILKKDYAPNVFWSILLEIGFIGWIGCTIGFIFRVFTGEKGFDSRRALLWGGLIIIFYALWIVGMMRA